jgi:hypothetical protein
MKDLEIYAMPMERLANLIASIISLLNNSPATLIAFNEIVRYIAGNPSCTIVLSTFRT